MTGFTKESQNKFSLLAEVEKIGVSIQRKSDKVAIETDLVSVKTCMTLEQKL